MSVKHAILGVLMQCPAHGYRIKKIFAPFLAKNGLNDGQLYPVLTSLEKKKLVRKEVVQQRKSPNRNIYHITDKGREEFMRWLRGGDDEVDPVKYDFFNQYRFLMKCNYFEHLSSEERIAKLEAQIEAAHEKIAEYKRIREEMREKKLNDFKLKIVDFGIETQLLKIRWVKDLLDSENGTTSGKAGRAAAQRGNTESTPAKK